MNHQLIRFEDFEADLKTGELRRAGQPVKLQPQPFKVLALLLSRPGQLVTQDEMREELWGSDTFVDFEQGLRFCIRRIRSALADDPRQPRYVETVPRRGYRFVAPLEPAEVAATEPAAPEPGSAPAQQREFEIDREQPRPRRGAVMAVGLAAVVVATLLIWQPWRPSRPPDPITSLAVLPLANLSGDSEQDYVAEGLTDLLINELTQIGSLRVISRRSTMQYQDTRETIPDIASDLGVDAVIEGSVASSGGRIRVIVQLVHGSTDDHVWARTYERELEDALVLQQEIASHVAREIHAALTPDEARRLSVERTVHPDAYLAYLKGLQLWDRRTVAALRGALESFMEACAIDPGYAEAHAAVAATYALMADSEFAAMAPSDAAPKIAEAAGRALALDEELGFAHAVLALTEFQFNWDWEAADRHFQRALELSPGDATTRQWYAWYLIAMGRFESAEVQMAEAAARDPLSVTIATDSGSPLFFGRRFDAAIERFQAALSADPTFVRAYVGLARAYEQKGMLEESIANIRRAVEITNRESNTVGMLGKLLGLTGRRAEAEGLLAELERRAQDEYIPPMAIGSIYLGLGEIELTLDYVEEMVDQHSGFVPYFAVAPDLDSLRREPRFQALLNRLQLPPRLATLPAS